MTVYERLEISPGILSWARKTAGYSDAAAAAKKLAVKPEQVQAWEDGMLRPTIVQLRRMGKVYKRPLAVLLLPEPPKDFMPLREFRRMNGNADLSWSPTLQAEFKRAHTQREVVLEIAEVSPSSIVISKSDFKIKSTMSAEDAGSHIRQLIGIDQWDSSIRGDPRLALRAAVTAVEQLGVLILQTRGVSIKEMRGFSISDWPYPVIALNGSDWPRPRLFTLIHELTHLALNAGGICDLHETSKQSNLEQDRVERYCNEVAGAALMPAAALLANRIVASRPKWDLDLLGDICGGFSTSSEALLLRLIDLGNAGWDDYRRLKPQLDALYEDARKREKARQKAQKSGPSFYVVKARDLGHNYVIGVLDAFQSRAISSYDVADYLDVKYNQLPKLCAALTP